MFQRLLAVLIFLLNPVASTSQQGGSEIQDVIREQIRAFEQGDLESAFSFASPNIRTIFRTPEQFGNMVRQGYPMVWEPSSFHFGSARSASGGEYQIVIFVDGSGQYHALEYEMIPMDGGWKINGVRILEMRNVGA